MNTQIHAVRSGATWAGAFHKVVRAIQVLFLLAVALVAMIPSVYADGNDLDQFSSCHGIEQPAVQKQQSLL